MTIAKSRTTLLLNWYTNPYHTSIVVAKALNYYAELGINLAILEPTDPSDVTEIVGGGSVDIGLKAMVHCYAARSRGYPIKSIGNLLHEPPTGLIFLKRSGINNFADIRGKRLGYVGEFGKVMIDDLARCAGIEQDQFETVRVGMNISHAIQKNHVDAGIGIGCFQKVELESITQQEAGILRIDELADLGCCCFCSVLYITHETFLQENPETLTNFMRATERATAYTLANPEKAFAILAQAMPRLDTPMYRQIFYHCLPYFSRDLRNVDRDWQRVGKYCQQLGMVSADFDPGSVYTNEFVPECAYAEHEPV